MTTIHDLVPIRTPRTGCKNLNTLARAFSRLHERRPELELVVAGAEGWEEVFPRRAPAVPFLGYVTDSELADLYRGAAVVCYPSLFEGFGLPVVVTDHPSFDEASGDAAIRVDPLDPDAIAAGIEGALAASERHVAPGIAHAARYSPEACGRAAVLSGYEEIRG